MTWIVLPRRAGSGEEVPILASACRSLARLDPHEHLIQLGNRAVLEPEFRLEPELDFLGLVIGHAAEVERQVCGDEVADLGPALELRHELGVTLLERLDLGVDIGLGDRLDRALDRQGLVGGEREVGSNFDFHLEGHRPVIGQLDRLDVQLGLRDRVELVLLVDLLEAAISKVDLTWPATCLRNRFSTSWRGARPGRKPGTTASLAIVPTDSSNCFSTSERGIVTLRCFLHGPTSLILHVEIQTSLRLDGLGGSVFGGGGRFEVFPGAHRRRSFVATGWDGLGRHHAPDAFRA